MENAELKTRYKFIHFVKNENGDVRWLYDCKNNRTKDLLGYIGCYSSWRRYVFIPVNNSVFSVDCLQDIIHFIEQLKIG